MDDATAARLTAVCMNALTDARVHKWVVFSYDYGITFKAYRRVPDSRRVLVAGQGISYLQLADAYEPDLLLAHAFETCARLIAAEAGS